ncbi:hypothetical protein K435DRAFT_972078 [Dendrothele bispora CBS 962.96]|uniref:Uncharacterized protein n=1 Tax=Dendrothele bispora (strain CBS 962.96) TaxID=1314807 RepID=A0A4V4HC63_DENBC|nr:hypothetical protein K435DRAFT_972078 [Dendrothele bispora CBS 962.96]
MPPITIFSAAVAGVIFPTFVYGAFFVLWFIAILFKLNHIAISTKHPYPYSRSHLFQVTPLALKHPLVIGVVLLFLFITGHWICQVIHFFDFVTQLQNNSVNPNIFFANLAEKPNVIEAIFLQLSFIASDCIIIYRLWVIWSYNWHITIFPVLTTCGFSVCSVGLIYQFSQYHEGDSVFRLPNSRWILSDGILTLCTNGYYASLLLSLPNMSSSNSPIQF